MIVYGINPVLEALRAGRVKQLWIAQRRDDRMRDLLAFATTHGISPQHVAPDVLSRRARGGVHQGVVADIDDAAEYSLDDLVRGASGPPLIVVSVSAKPVRRISRIASSTSASSMRSPASAMFRRTMRFAAWSLSTLKSTRPEALVESGCRAPSCM